MRKKYLPFIALLILCSSLYSQNYRLVNPKDNFVSSTDTITFKWSKVDSATSYDIIIATDSDFSNPVFQLNDTFTTTVQKILPFGSTYYWQIRANIPQTQLWSYYRSFSIFRPSQLSGLVMWFDAAQNVVATGGAVSQWSDLSPSALVATQNNAANKPTLVTSAQLCNKPVVHFTGTGGASTSSNLAFATLNLSDYTALIMRSYTHNNNYMQYVIGGVANGLCAESNYYGGGFGTYQGTSNSLYASLASTQVPGFGVFTTQPNHVFRNSVEVPHAPSNAFYSSFTITGVSLSTIGARTDAVTLALSYLGDVGEIVLYDNSLSDANRNLAEKYLRYKFAPPVDLGADTILNKFCVNVNLNAGSCFASYLWSPGGQTTASINVTSLGTYTVRATDFLGYTSYDTINVRPLIPFHQLPDTVFLCAGDSVIWNTGYPAAGYQFTWSPGNATTPALAIKNSGIYSVAIKDAFNCTFNSKSVRVIVDPFPNYSLGPDTSFCSGNRLNFVYPDSLQSILWSNGDTTNETVINSQGNYSVIAVNMNGCIAKDTIHVNIKGYAPFVNFTNPILCATDSILFTDSSFSQDASNIIWRTWNFGNNDTTNELNPTHVFAVNGQYVVTLIALTDSGCVNSVSKTLSVYLKPHADFQAKVSCAESETPFTDLSTTAPPAALGPWKWHFAGVDSSIFKNPKYVFPAPGKYPVNLKVTNSDGCSDVASDSIEVFAAFSANFSVQNVCAGDSVSFADITPSFSIVSWLWNTGDNIFATKKTFKHKYTASGSYPVTLQIQNAIGCIDSTSQTVTIYKKPVAAFNGLFTCEDQNYTPLDASTVYETNNSWYWNIAGSIYHTQAPQHFFANTGDYTVQLKITSESGCKDSVSHVVHVEPVPVAAFTFTPIYGDAPLTVTFQNQSVNASSYFWNFGDGSADVVPNPTHIYITNDTFQIKLVATNDFGCVDSSQKNITVIHTDLDISVDYVDATPSPLADGTVMISVTAYANNIGTRLITDVKFYATIGTGGVISEDWSGTLPSGAALPYVFTAHFIVAAANANSYVCVEAKSVNNGETETRIDNNRQCASVNGVLQTIGPSPNPARETAYLGLIMPKAGKVTIDIVDLLGKIVMQEEELDLPAGRTDYNIPVKLLRAGEYFIRIKNNDDKLLKKLVVH